MYDREHKQIGFWKTNCSELWEKLRISDVPPKVPPITEGKNSTEALEPAVAPSESHYNLHPGIINCWSSIILFLIIRVCLIKWRVRYCATHEVFP